MPDSMLLQQLLQQPARRLGLTRDPQSREPKALQLARQSVLAQQQAQQNAQDPVLQIQMQELQLKQQEVQIKQQELQLKTEKVRSDSAAKAEELAIRKSQIEMTAELESIKMGAKAASEQRESDARQQIEGIRIGSEMAIRERELDQRGNKPPQGE